MPVGALLTAGVPMARTLGLEFAETSPERAVAVLPDRDAFRHHAGGPHTGALYALGESAGGALVLTAFAGQLARAVPVAVRADLAYGRLPLGAVTATATLCRPAAETVAALDAGETPEIPVRVELRREDGELAAEMTVVWTLRPLGCAGADGETAEEAEGAAGGE